MEKKSADKVVSVGGKSLVRKPRNVLNNPHKNRVRSRKSNQPPHSK